jgi:hypothetical protein
MKNVATPTKLVMTPRTMNINCHPLRLECCTCWKPKETMPPMIWPTPRPQYHKLNLGACSDLVYHWLLMSMRQGAIEASKMPRKMRATSRE